MYSSTIRLSMTRLQTLLLFLLASTSLMAQSTVTDLTVPPASSARVELLASDPGGISVGVSGLRPVVVRREGRVVVLHNAQEHIARAVDAPRGAFVVQVAVPHDATDISASIVRPTIERAALPAGIPTGFPRDWSPRVSSPVMLRSLRVVTLTVDPVVARDGSLEWFSSATIRVTWKSSAIASKGGVPRTELPSIERMMRGSIINYDQAARWGTPRNGVRALGASSWGMGKGIVLLTPADAIYRISGAELAASGETDLLGASVDRLSLTRSSIPVSFHLIDNGQAGIVDALDTLEFIGMRSRGVDGLYYDEVTDTGATILRWDGSRPTLRATSAPVGTNGQALLGYDSTLRFERDLIYYPGHDIAEEGGGAVSVNLTLRAENERFFQTKYVNRSLDAIPFDCSPMYRPGGTVTVRARMICATPASYTMTLALNDFGSLGEFTIEGYADTLLQITVPVNYLVNGRNTLKITAEQESDMPREIYFDYIELVGRWMPSAFASTAEFTIPTGQTSRDAKVSIVGFDAPPRLALGDSLRVSIDTVERGVLFRLSSRAFEGGLRANRNFLGQFGGVEFGGGSFQTGIMLAEFDGTTGALLREGKYETYTRPADYKDAVQFVKDVRDGNYLVAGFAIGFGSPDGDPANIAAANELKSVLAALGSKEITRPTNELFVSQWAFAARKGSGLPPAEAFAKSDIGVTLDAFFPTSTGTIYRAKFSVAGDAGDRFFVGNGVRPATRYHGEDQLVSNTNQAGMIIVSHPAFMAEANRLAAHRRAVNGLTVRVVDVHSIYDEFNEGIKSPRAIRRFLQYADTNWADPKPGYVLLVGDASWDPQRRLIGSVMIDYVPTIGIPASDYLYTVPFGDTTMMWRQLIGRLPSATIDDARAVVDKLIEYDTLPPAAWNKRFVMLAGGLSRGEVEAHRSFYTYLAEEYILGPAYQGDTAIVFRTSEDVSLPDDKDGEWARQEINKGTMWLSFTGHGSTSKIDLEFGDPDDLDNEGEYFIFGTFSCSTGAFGEPGLVLRNEAFLQAPRRAAVATIGSTATTGAAIDNAIEAAIFERITLSHMTNLGEIFTDAKMEMYQSSIRSDTAFASVANYRNHLEQYALLGDPSMTIASRRTVELAVPAERATIEGASGGAPTLGDTVVMVEAELWNYGRVIDSDDSVTVTATIIDQNRQESIHAVVVHSPRRSNRVSFTLPLSGGPAEYTIRIEANPEGRFDESERSDNLAVLQLRVRGANQPLPLEPIPFGRVAARTNVHIRVLNPSVPQRFDIVVDTASTFDSPALFTSRTVGTVDSDASEGLVTDWTFDIPSELASATRFWWKTVALDGDTLTSRLFPTIETFTVDTDPGEFLLGGIRQMSETQLVDLVNGDDGVGPGSRSVPLMVSSIGQSRYSTGSEILGEKVDMEIGTRNYTSTTTNSGINVFVLPPGGATPIRNGTFHFYQGNELMRRFVDFIRDSVDVGERVLLAASGVSFTELITADPTLKQDVIDAFRSIGSTAIDSIAANGGEDSYALIGGKGLAATEVREGWVRAAPLRLQGIEPPYRVEIRDTVSAIPQAGRLMTRTIGPATSWRSARVDLAPSSTSQTRLTAIGLRRDGKRDTLVNGLGASLDLSSIDARLHPRIELRVDFANDTTQRLRSLRVDFDPSPELAIVPSSFRLQPDSVLQGDRAPMLATVINLSRTRPSSEVAIHALQVKEGRIDPVDSTTVPALEAGRKEDVALSIPTDRIKGSHAFQMALNPWDQPSEPYRQNNMRQAVLRVGVDEIAPDIAIYADGNRLMPNDYVNPNATFEVKIYDNSSLQVDSTIIRLNLDAELITASTPGAKFDPTPKGLQRASLRFVPSQPLEAGSHALQLFTSDATGNIDSSGLIFFNVEHQLKLDQVANVPNPFAQRTTFTFMVAGSTTPRGGEIAIFTPSGRKVKTIRLSPSELNIGFNRVDWDGRDDDGDAMANGVYLYRVTVEDGEAKQQTLEKLVIMK